MEHITRVVPYEGYMADVDVSRTFGSFNVIPEEFFAERPVLLKSEVVPHDSYVNKVACTLSEKFTGARSDLVQPFLDILFFEQLTGFYLEFKDNTAKFEGRVTFAKVRGLGGLTLVVVVESNDWLCGLAKGMTEVFAAYGRNLATGLDDEHLVFGFATNGEAWELMSYSGKHGWTYHGKFNPLQLTNAEKDDPNVFDKAAIGDFLKTMEAVFMSLDLSLKNCLYG